MLPRPRPATRESSLHAPGAALHRAGDVVTDTLTHPGGLVDSVLLAVPYSGGETGGVHNGTDISDLFLHAA